MIYRVKPQPSEYAHNNVRFVPPEPEIWYRIIQKVGELNRTTHATIRFGNRQIAVAYFTSDRGDGFTAVIYQDGVQVADCVLPTRRSTISSAQKEALAWNQRLLSQNELK